MILAFDQSDPYERHAGSASGGQRQKTKSMSDTADPDVLYDAAHQLKEDGNLEAAVEALLKIVADHPGHVQSHLALGVHLQKLGQNDDAVRHASKVTELDPQDAFSWVQLSVIMQRCGKIQEAEDAMAKAHTMKTEAGQ